MCIAEGKDELQGKICGQGVYVRILKRLPLFAYTELCKNFIDYKLCGFFPCEHHKIFCGAVKTDCNRIHSKPQVQSVLCVV